MNALSFSHSLSVSVASESLSLAFVFLGEAADGFVALAFPAEFLGSGLKVPNKLLPRVESGPSDGRISWIRENAKIKLMQGRY